MANLILIIAVTLLTIIVLSDDKRMQLNFLISAIVTILLGTLIKIILYA